MLRKTVPDRFRDLRRDTQQLQINQTTINRGNNPGQPYYPRIPHGVTFAQTGIPALTGAILPVASELPDGWVESEEFEGLVSPNWSQEIAHVVRVQVGITTAGITIINNEPDTIATGSPRVTLNSFGSHQFPLPFNGLVLAGWNVDSEPAGMVIKGGAGGNFGTMWLEEGLSAQVDMTFDLGSDVEDVSGTYDASVTLTHIPLVRFG